MDIQSKRIDLDDQYYVLIIYHDNSIMRYYRLYNKDQDGLIVESYNRDSFLLKVNKIIKLTNQQELLIASI